MASLARACPPRLAADPVHRLERRCSHPSMAEELYMSRPEDIHSQFVTAFNSGNLDAIMALYEPEASLVPQPGQVVQGHAAVRQALIHGIKRNDAGEEHLHGPWSRCGVDARTVE